MTRHLHLPCLLTALLCSTAAASAADNILTLKARESTAQLEPRDAKQHHVTLPALDVAILASLACPAGTKAQSLTVSVSDTHQYFGAELLADAVSLEVAFNVPSNQLAPIAIPDFCVTGGLPDNQELGLPGIATAQVSLRCLSKDDSTSVHFSSAPVPVRLYCRADGDPESSATAR